MIRNELFKSDYSMLYFHLADMDSVWEKFLTKKKFEYYFKEPGFIFSRFSSASCDCSPIHRHADSPRRNGG